MGEVVKLEKPSAARRKAPAKTSGRRRRSRTALVLGGGGFTGGVYEIGALRALDLLAVNRTPGLEGQYLPLAGLPAGRYTLRHTVNPSHRVLESNYANNSASVSLELSWKDGVPAVRML